MSFVQTQKIIKRDVKRFYTEVHAFVYFQYNSGRPEAPVELSIASQCFSLLALKEFVADLQEVINVMEGQEPKWKERK